MRTDEEIRKMLPSVSVEIKLSPGQISRIRAYMERVNQEQLQIWGGSWEPNGGRPVYDESYDDFLIALDVLIGAGLRENETRHGLHGYDWGELVAIQKED